MDWRAGWTSLVFLALALISRPAVAAPAWPQFRGPGGDGVAEPTANPPVEWSESRNVAWKVSIPGRGRSSPVLLDGRIWLTTALERGVQRIRMGPDDMQTAEHIDIGAVCLDAADGRILWQVTLSDIDNPAPVHWFNSWATPTPVVEPGRLYCDFGTFCTACLDAGTGKILWSRRVPLDHQVGPGSSPVVYKNQLILVRDGRNAQYVAALDKESGEAVWKTDRPPLQAPTSMHKKSFSTPLVIEGGGRSQVVIPGPQWVVSYNPITGREIWRVRHGSGYSIGTRPVFGHGLVYVGTGALKAQLVAIRVDGEGDATATHVAWKTARQVPIMSSPVFAGDSIYWVSDDGTVSCADAKTGEVRWQERLGVSHMASPLYAGGRLYFFGHDGKATVIKPGSVFERLAENRLEGVVVATPAAIDRALFVRTDTHLYRIESR
jgi:outer membrane protein assembly factor BamB